EKRCRTLYAIDGVLEWRNAFENREQEPACPWTMRPVLCEKVAAIGRSQARQLSYWGNSSKVELTGLPRLDSLVSQAGSAVHSTSRRKKRILVATAKWPAFTDDQQIKLEQSLCDLRDCLKSEAYGDLEVTWRLARGLDQEIGVSNSLQCFSQGELAGLLLECDALITTPSTVMLEGMILNKPTAVLEYNDCPQLAPAVWQIRHRGQMKEVIQELIDPRPAKLAQQEFVLHDLLECRSPAIDRLGQLIRQMLQHEAGQSPAKIVPVCSPETDSSLGFDFLYNNHRLLESDNLHEMKVHIAGLEREVGRLQKRNDLLEHEFDRAKSTIENVFNNPVIAPFIKAGEFTGKLFGREKKSAT
ncbi:MAG: hypothetical protein VX438_19460, partial [Planctomycetota bacterium]|nr:hypothetical protein [Planctomycetota bacterium]